MDVENYSNLHLSKILGNLIKGSTKNYYNPYKKFDWPDVISEERYWMSPELLSVYGTSYSESLSERKLQHLSKWECVNFFSINVHGERGLLQSMLNYLHQPGFDEISEYIHHFIGEENEHMWFFSQFCLQYGKKIYKNKQLRGKNEVQDANVKMFLDFSMILIFEEIGDFYNRKMKEDNRLPEIVRQISLVHYKDESRHLVMGKEVVKILHLKLRKTHSSRQLLAIECYLNQYIQSITELFYNPTVYCDAEISLPYQLRRDLLSCDVRQDFHKKVLKRINRFFEASGIFTGENTVTGGLFYG